MSRALDLDEVDAALSRAAARAINGTLEERSGRILISTVEYNDEGRELWVIFTNGETYRYRDVPPEVYEGLLATESRSAFFDTKIKDVFPPVEPKNQTKSET